jgi:serine/threonine protein kinase
VVIEPDTLKVQLIDFGSARPVDDVVALEDITIAYAPPEVYNSQTATKLVAQSLDLWCLGVLLFTMMYSRSPFSSSYDAQACILNFDRSMHSTGTTVR